MRVGGWFGLALVAGATLLTADAARAVGGDPIGDRLAVLEKTETMLADKSELRAGELRTRVRSLYKLSRAGWAPLWIDADERAAMLRRRAAARRILARDLEELAILEDETRSAADARARLEAEADAAARAVRPAPASLARPVAGALVSRFGRFRGRRSGTWLTNRGIALAASAGEPVAAPHGGIVRYAGQVRGLGDAVVIERDDGVRSVVGQLEAVLVARGDAVEAGQPLAHAAGPRVYLEVRIAVGAGGLPVDPAPLLAR